MWAISAIASTSDGRRGKESDPSSRRNFTVLQCDPCLASLMDAEEAENGLELWVCLRR
jgi:hypothetical protein